MVSARAVPASIGPPLLLALNKLLGEGRFDAYVEGLCGALNRAGGRPGHHPTASMAG